MSYKLADYMRENCSSLIQYDSGHWMAQEKPDDLENDKKWLAILKRNLILALLFHSNTHFYWILFGF